MGYHEPVLLNEVLEGLNVKPCGKYIDCTLGDGGHTIGILKAGGEVLGIDYEQGSLDRTVSRIEKEGLAKAFTGVLGNFRNIENIAKENGFSEVNGILYDLGYSSTQILDESLGISFLKDQPLDMRLDKSLGVTASDLVNALPEDHLTKLFKEYGEEKYSKRFAKAIIESRNLKKIDRKSVV